MWGDLISAGALIAGGLLGHNAAQKGLNWQKHLARNQIQMRVADAKKAGISPLAALGASLYSGGWTSNNALGQGVADAGAAVAGAIQKRADQAKADELFDLQREKLQAEIFETRARAGREAAEAGSIAHDMAQASQIARLAQTAGINKDGEQNMLPPGTVLRTSLGNIVLDEDASQEIVEQELGGGIGELHGFIRGLKAWLKNAGDSESDLRALKDLRRRAEARRIRDERRGRVTE